MDFLKAAAWPWLAEPIARLRAAGAADRLPHSLLILAAPGLGAAELAAWAGAFALCEAEAAARPCGECGSCALLRADAHPDWHAVRVEEDAQQIKVDQVRALIESLAQKSYRGGYKVGLIEGAEALNANGANAFLKTLEEPTARTLLMLTAARSHRLPPTVASRCLKLALRPPERETALAWLRSQSGEADGWEAPLALSGGAPLRAIELRRAGVAELDAEMRRGLADLVAGRLDLTVLAERWVRADPAPRVAWLENWVTTRILAGVAGPNDSKTAESVRLPAGARGPKITAMYALLDAIRDFRRLATTGVNPQLALEALLLRVRSLSSGT